MKKRIILTLIFPFFIYCCSEQEKVERYTEDGVEVVVNYLEPYKIKGEPSSLHLEEKFRIDSEKDMIAEIGLTNLEAVDVDSKGNIYILNRKNKASFNKDNSSC